MKLAIPLCGLGVELRLATAPAAAEERQCTGRLGAVYLDNIFVPDGASCTLDGTRAKGNIVVGTGAALSARSVSVNGNLQAEGAHSVRVHGRSTFGGSVQIVQGGTTLRRNQMKGNLQCRENIPAPTGGGNRAASKEDQCARL